MHKVENDLHMNYIPFSISCLQERHRLWFWWWWCVQIEQLFSCTFSTSRSFSQCTNFSLLQYKLDYLLFIHLFIWKIKNTAPVIENSFQRLMFFVFHFSSPTHTNTHTHTLRGRHKLENACDSGSPKCTSANGKKDEQKMYKNCLRSLCPHQVRPGAEEVAVILFGCYFSLPLFLFCLVCCEPLHFTASMCGCCTVISTIMVGFICK